LSALTLRRWLTLGGIKHCQRGATLANAVGEGNDRANHQAVAIFHRLYPDEAGRAARFGGCAFLIAIDRLRQP